MSLYNGPPRPGARGGRAEFSWDNVKADKDREYYLGHSVKATTGRWAKGKDIFWYTKGKGDSGVSQSELEAVKAREREMMAEALGLKPKAAPKQLKQPSLEKHEVEKLLKGAGAEEEAPAEGERIKGLGFGSGAAVAVREEIHEVMQGTAPSGRGTRSAAAADAADNSGLITAEQLAHLARADDRASRKAEKKEKKKAKKEKRDRKGKEAKHKKKKHKHRSKSSSGSSSSDSDAGQRHHHHRHHVSPEQGILHQERKQHEVSERHLPHAYEHAQYQQQNDRRHDSWRSPIDKRLHNRSSEGRQQRSRSPVRRGRYSRSPVGRGRNAKSDSGRRHHSRSPPASRRHSRSPEDSRQLTRKRSPHNSRHPPPGSGRERSRSPRRYNSSYR